ncbi:hypothetical protein HPB49_012259 [Dermacentor silvarum]|uniref:Uncharacterized protein n=1 Tax=Dermacentor silvarum TaxID=543639 RepID=A0ACB8D4Y9_DERSI|nr:hypothetical protein HPB49_012259 [Dermacentor silvarum]
MVSRVLAHREALPCTFNTSVRRRLLRDSACADTCYARSLSSRPPAAEQPDDALDILSSVTRHSARVREELKVNPRHSRPKGAERDSSAPLWPGSRSARWSRVESTNVQLSPVYGHNVGGLGYGTGNYGFGYGLGSYGLNYGYGLGTPVQYLILLPPSEVSVPALFWLWPPVLSLVSSAPPAMALAWPLLQPWPPLPTLPQFPPTPLLQP